MKRALVLAAAAGALVLGAATGDAAPRIDFAGVALNVLPPGQGGDLWVRPSSSSAARLPFCGRRATGDS